MNDESKNIQVRKWAIELAMRYYGNRTPKDIMALAHVFAHAATKGECDWAPIIPAETMKDSVLTPSSPMHDPKPPEPEPVAGMCNVHWLKADDVRDLLIEIRAYEVGGLRLGPRYIAARLRLDLAEMKQK